MEVRNFIDKWAASGAAERANKDAFLIELCDVLGVPRPDPATGDPERDLYVFERDVHLPHEGDRLTVGRIDLYRHRHFLLEAKQGSQEGSKKLGTARRGTPAWNIAMRDAYGQALGYARTLSDPPPFLVTCDIGYCFDLYAAFDKSWNYRPFPDGQGSRIYLTDFEKYADRLRAVFLDPHSLDPATHAARVTREIATHLAQLARELEESGQDPERVATFLMRCIFTLFAEDVGLLPDHLFTDALDQHWISNPASFPAGISTLWKAMNDGSSFGFLGKLLRFNGGLFADQQALPLTRPQLERLKEAAHCTWADVEPAIFGTLLERALDPRERHRLGAHYTPRAYVERLVRPTIEEPLRADWDLVRAEVRRLVEDGKVDDAQKAVRTFHRRLTKTRVLDPACGSGNFLYVSLDLFKRLESEVLGLLRDLGEKQDLLEIEGATVTPEQFRGIEVKRWAKEIAELVLWIGYIQWQVRTHGSAKAIPEPVLRDYGNIEYRDAVLAYDRKELVVDEKGVPVTQWDGITYKKSSVTGEDIPDEAARVPVYRYVNPRRAEWPLADFVVGNPPFVGNWRMRTVLGEGYTEALRSAHLNVPDGVDFVMYWWDRAATLLQKSHIRSFGLITTNSIVQTRNRRVLSRYIETEDPLTLIFAIPDHPWVDSTDSAAVRISMTVASLEPREGRMGVVIQEMPLKSGEMDITLRFKLGCINANLTIGIDLTQTKVLKSNDHLCSPGVKLHGAGFIVTRGEAKSLGLGRVPGIEMHIREYRNGKDLAGTARGSLVIDLNGLSIEEVRDLYPEIYQRVLERVKPERDQNNEKYRRENWWLFGRRNTELRSALKGIRRYISTPETSKHRFFVFLGTDILPDNRLTNFALEDAMFLGILSSRTHIVWSLASGGTLEDRPVYNKTRCFDPFPFPCCGEDLIIRIRTLGEALDAHRKRQQSLHPDLTMTGIYNVLEKLRAGEALNEKEKKIHEQGLVSVLKQIHDDLDTAVFDAYGWPHDLTDEQILERLVALNAERAEEERNGLVRWLRPEFQNPGGTQEQTQAALPGTETPDEEAAVSPVATPWPKKLPEQVAAIRGLLLAGHAWGVEQVAKTFKGARRREVEGVLESLAALGLAVTYDTPEGRRWRGIERGILTAA
jgi:hypothetical protein